MPDITPHDDTRRWDVDPIERLRRANPAPPGEVAAQAGSARARAVYEEITMEEHMKDATPAPDEAGTGATAPRWFSPRWAAATAVLVIAGAIGIGVGLTSGSPADDAPIAGEQPDQGAPPAMSGMCAEQYSLETLTNRDVAFAGTLTAVEGDTLTFSVDEVFRGDVGDEAQLGGASSITAISPDNDAPVAVGDRLLVAGSGGFAWGCGFTMPYDEATAQQWRDTLS